ncbi:DNA polymerase [Alphaentomopoxvirus acuprea]|uniref:DNA polymerase n=1 Tax=Alphaentomopoxvirus acuprea TaxID=62099 RepID=W6JLP9_9POXV|nr:DNA polymerase [Anomala cuprea entomopoxvirus]BAO49586.1 DNA polymerase [Anomala cuprea entomopoxvirus]
MNKYIIIKMPIRNNHIFKTKLISDSFLSDEDAIHYLKKLLNINDDTFLPGNNQPEKEIDIKIFNWYTVKFNRLEEYIVCKAKDYNTQEIIYFIFDLYNYFLCSEDDVDNNEYLKLLKNNIIKFNNDNIAKIITLNEFKIISNEVQIQKYYNFRHNLKDKEIYKNLYLFLTRFKISRVHSDYNHNFNFYRWFYVLNDINPAGSYKINLKYCKEFNVQNKFNSKTYYCDDPKLLFSNKITSDKFLPVSRLSFDIECKHNGIFPKPETCPISHICAEWYDDGDSSISKKKIFILINTNIILDYVNYVDKFDDKFINDIMNNNNVYNYIYATEQVILEFMIYLFLQDFDYILSYNGHNFDIPYIQGRLNYYRMGNLVTQNIMGVNNLLINQKITNLKTIQDIRHDIASNNATTYLDIYNYVKEFYKLPSYKLDTIAKYKFNINAKTVTDGKITTVYPYESSNIKKEMFYKVLRTANYCFINDKAFKIYDKKNIINNESDLYNFESIKKSIGKEFKIYNNDIEISNNVEITLSKDDVEIWDKNAYKNYKLSKAKDIAFYCVHDTILCNKLFEIDMIDYKIAAFSQLYLLPQNKSLLYRNSTNSLGQILYTLLKNKMMIVTGHVDYDKYEGAMVYDPKKKYVSNPTLIFDFKSLYPTAIIEGNLSPEKIEKVIISDDEIANTYIDTYLADTYKYPKYLYIKIKSNINNKTIYTYIVTDKSSPGLISIILMKGLDERNKYKQLKSENSNNEILCNLYDNMQYGIKIIINSIYGLLGSNQFIFRSKYCAQYCTALSKKSIMYIHEILDKSIYKSNILTINSCNNIFTQKLIKTKYEGNINEDFIIDIVYGDTDSLFMSIIFNKEMELDYKIRKAIDIGNFLSNIINKNDIFPDIFEFEFEDVNCWIVFTSKKKYLAEHVKLITDDIGLKKIKDDIIQLNFINKGTLLVRRDYCKFHKDTYKNIVDIIKCGLKSNKNVELEIENYVINVIDDTLANIRNLNIDDFVKTMTYSGKYKDKNNIIDNIVKNYNRNNPNNKIMKGNRFSFVYGTEISKWDKSYESWNFKNTNDINQKIIIIGDDIKYDNIIRICIEKYIINLLNNINMLLNNKNIIKNIKDKYKKNN